MSRLDREEKQQELPSYNPDSYADLFSVDVPHKARVRKLIMRACATVTLGMFLVGSVFYSDELYRTTIISAPVRDIVFIPTAFADTPSYSQGSYSGTGSYTGSYGSGSTGSYGGGTGSYTSSYGGGTGSYTSGYTGSYTRSYTSSYGGGTGSYTSGYTGSYTSGYTGSYAPTGGGGGSIECVNGATFTPNGDGTYTRTGPNGETSTVSQSYVNSALSTGSYTSGYTGVYTKTYTTLYTTGYTGSYTSGYTRSYTTLYTTGYTGSYTSGYTRSYTTLYTTGYTGSYTSGYTRSYTTLYTTGYTGSYTRSYTGSYGGCFTADTLVETTEGLVAIIDIEPGTKVISYDEENDVFTTSVVGEVIEHSENLQPHDFSANPLIAVTVENNDVTSTTKATSNHRYFDPETKLYKPIGEFRVGDTVRTKEGLGVIADMSVLIDGSDAFEETFVRVYNLHMSEGPSNYLTNGVVVHNAKAQ